VNVEGPNPRIRQSVPANSEVGEPFITPPDARETPATEPASSHNTPVLSLICNVLKIMGLPRTKEVL
jgi:hypothetical protein